MEYYQFYYDLKKTYISWDRGRTWSRIDSEKVSLKKKDVKDSYLNIHLQSSDKFSRAYSAMKLGLIIA